MFYRIRRTIAVIIIGSLISFFLSHHTFAHAGDVTGRVVSVADGDTLTVLTSRHDQIRVRLAEIDAPEKSQAFGQRSKQSLSALCFGKEADVETVDTDRYGRTVGKVTCNGVNANLEQVRSGNAWAYRKYLRDQGVVAAEDEARAAGRGLWSERSPTPPWEFRKAARNQGN